MISSSSKSGFVLAINSLKSSSIKTSLLFTRLTLFPKRYSHPSSCKKAINAHSNSDSQKRPLYSCNLAISHLHCPFCFFNRTFYKNRANLFDLCFQFFINFFALIVCIVDIDNTLLDFCIWNWYFNFVKTIHI